MRGGGWRSRGRLLGVAALAATMAGGLAGGGAMPPAGPSGAEAQAPADTRQTVPLEPREREAVLAEMRQMLGSLGGVLQGLVTGDHAAIERAARLSGMGKAADPRLRQKVPASFLELGMRTHQRFEQLADAAKAGASQEEILRALAETTTNCVACHAAYRF